MMIFGVSEWIVLLTTVLGVAGYYYWKKMQYFKDRNIKYVSGIPVFGSTLGIVLQLEHIIKFLKRMYYSFPKEKYVGLFSFSTPVVIVKDLDLIKQIFVKDFDHFTDHVDFVDPETDPLTGKMLFLMKGDEWREMRTTLSPAFTSSKMRGMFPFMQECANYLIQYLDKKFAERNDKATDCLEMEIKDAFTRCTNDIIATCGFGFKTNSLVDTENTFYKMSKSFTTIDAWQNFKLAIFSFLPFVSKIFKIEFGRKEVTDFFRDLVNSNMKEREEKNIVRQDMIHLLMLAKQGKLVDETSEGRNTNQKNRIEWTNDELISQVLVFLFAGFESTATMLSFLAYELAKDQEVQKKLQEEIDGLLDRSNDELDYEGINCMKYLDMVCSETLRLWPVAPNTDRVCTKNYTLPPQSDENSSSLELKKGDQIWIPTITIHRDPSHFPDPDKFDPERFSDENKHSIKPFSYIPFGMGPRQCIGTRFALMEVKVLIAKLLSKYDLLKTSKTADTLILRNSLFDMIPVDGYWVGLRPRRL